MNYNKFSQEESRKVLGMVRRFKGYAAWLGCITAIVLIMSSMSANAQLSGKGAITGTVADSTGAVIPNATVIASNGATGIETQTTTTAAGAYNFPNLDPGIYSVTIAAEGFQKLKQENVHVNAMESASFNPVMTIGRADVQVTVTAEPPQIETSNATLGATMEQETYAALPVQMGAYGQADQRRATDFVYLMPGVQGNNTNGNATTNVGVVNGSGSRGAASAVYVDGLPFVRAGGNGDPRYVWTAISVDAIDQFQVQTTGYSALYEGQGVMNYTVKRGGNQFHGSVYEFFRNTALDTWGFWGKTTNTPTGKPIKPVEHSNEYGIAVGGQLIPFGGLKDKLYFFTNYNGFRYSSATPTPITLPTLAQQQGDFSAAGLPKIYDPATTAACTHTVNGVNYAALCRTQFAGNIIPAGRLSPQMKALQSYLPTTGISTALSNNYIASNSTGLNNWSTTSRIDYTMTSKDTLSVIGAVGRQASSVPVGQTTSGRNVGPVPYNYGQAYAPKTAVWIIEETHVFTPNIVNQIKYGYARYNGPTFTPNKGGNFSAQKNGINGTPVGQATNNFPIVTFPTGGNNPTNWGGTTENSTIAQNYTFLDELQWTFGKHSLTFGGQIAWMLYNTYSATGGTTPLTLGNATTETANILTTTTSNTDYTTDSSTGFSYASFLLGQVDKGSLTDYSYHPGYGARFRAISPFVQDDWKVTPKLTLNLGLRYDFFPTVREVHNFGSFFDPYLANPVTGLKGAINYTGNGAGTCNCSTPANNYYKNFGPRIGLAYQLDSKTVVRASYGVMFTHGNAVGGLTSSIGVLGMSAAPSFSSSKSQTTMTNFVVNPTTLAPGSGAIPTYTGAAGAASGPAYGTGYTTISGYTAAPQSGANYADPYYGSRAPEYINWSFGLQRQLTNTIALNASYVGSEGHFLQLDNYSARGYWSNGLDPKYLYLGTKLGDQGAAALADCATYNLPCAGGAAGSNIFTASQPLSQLLKPFPFQAVADNFGYVGNANYHALQTVLTLRNLHGLTTTVNYTWSRAIDDGGYFRTGYAIPAGTIYGNANASYPADRIERTVSTSNQPHHFVTTAVWKWPLGKSVLADNAVERAIMGGFSFSGVYQIYSGSPLMITASSCNTNPATPSANFCPPSYAPGFTGPARINGRWGKGVTLANFNSTAFIDKTAFVATPSYFIGNLPRTAPYNIYGPSNYQLDLGMTRSFPLHLTEASKLDFRAEWYNVTNKTFFGVASTAWTANNSSFGQVTSNGSANRKAAQFSARVNF
jgi:hypothetical protein